MDRCIICEFRTNFFLIAQCASGRHQLTSNEFGRYSLTIGFSICTAVFIYNPAVHLEWHNLVLEFNIAISSVTACRLVRELKLDSFQEEKTEKMVSNVVFRDMGIVSHQESESASEPGTGDAIGVDLGGMDKPYPRDIEVRAARNGEIEDRG